MTGTSTYTQDFNSLTANGTWTDDSTIAGWYSQRSGTGTTFTIGTGSGTGGGLYSFGIAAASDRALGTLGSGNAAAGNFAHGLLLQNTDLTPIEVNQISFVGEQWRNSGAAAAQTVSFFYQISASSIGALTPNVSTGWTPLAALNFISPITGGTAGAIDGNATANRTVLSQSTALVVPPGSYLMLKWDDPDHSGADHGLAIDDVSVSWSASGGGDTTAPSITSRTPADDATGLPLETITSLNLTFSENVIAGTGEVVLKKVSDDSTVISFTVDDTNETAISGTDVTFLLNEPSPLEVGTAYYVEIPGTAFKDAAENFFPGITGNTGWNFETAGPPPEPTAIPMTGTASYSQDFNSLANTGTPSWIDGNTIIGWYSNRETYSPDAGTATSGGLYSFGAAAATERALGSIGSNNAGTSYYGVVLRNTDTVPIEIDSISYTGEQWRNGGNATAQVLTVGYLISSTAITDVNAGTFLSLSGLTFTSPVATATAAALDGDAVANRALLTASTQLILQPGEYVMIQWTDLNDSGSDHGLSIDDLTVSWKPSVGGDTTPPSISSRTPADDATGLPLATIPNLSLTFSESVIAGTGEVLLKKVSDNSTVISFTVNDTNETAISESGTDVTFFLNEPSPLEVGTAYYVEIPGTAFKDAAENFFPGITGNTGWNFETAGPPADPSVVINKYSNGSPDTVELLVVGNETPGSTVDLRGMIVKDFSSNMVNDNGGKFEFTTDALWEAVPVGTLVVLTKNATTTDTSVLDGNFTLRVGLDDTTYFTSLGGTFDIAGTDMVMIKAAGSGSAGTTGGIHALAGGTEGALFTSYPGAKVIAATGGSGVRVENSTGDLDDFKSGTDATGGISFLPAQIGVASNGTNGAYIAALRGIVSSDGDGASFVINTTPGSPFANVGMFDRGQTGDQVATLVLNAFIPTVTLTDVEIEVPTELGTPTLATVSIAGAGATSASFSISGQTITVSSAAVTTTDSLQVSISGLSTPTPNLITDNGNYVFAVKTAGSGGTLTNLAVQPAARVLIPISALRDVNANGVALDLGTIVAVDGVCTEENFGTANTQAFIQKDGAGVNVFYSVEPLTLTRGKRYAAVGPLIQFNGLTEVSLAAATDLVDLGVDTEPAPEVVTLATLFADPESYEGKLITVEGLSYVSGGWTNGENVVLEDAANTPVTVRIQAGSSATPAPTFPANITGIFSQFDSSSPFTSGYQLQPRDINDLESAASDFDTWASQTGATGGMTGDDDLDGRDNAFEYAFGLNPTSGGSVTPFTSVLNKTTGEFTFTRRKPSLTGLTYTYEYHTSLTGAWTPFTPAVTPVTNGGDPVEAVTVTVPAILLTEPKLFIRIVTP
jgi:hypothetical protein